MPPPPKHPRLPASAIGAFIRPGEIEALLEPFVPDAGDREWVVRCVLDAGPAHHRGANYVLLALLGRVLERLPPAEPATEAPQATPVPMRVGPHDHGGEVYPLGVPRDVLDALAPAGSRQQAAMIDCLTDGPPQHALANAAMVQLIREILRRLPDPG